MSSKDGEILWRKVLETEGSRGEIKLLHVITDLSAKSVSSGDNFGIITVSGSSPVLIRGWDTRTGNLAFEWSLTPLTENSDSLYFFKDSKIYHVVPVWKSHIELTEYHASTGQQDSSTTRKITAGWISKSDCVLNGENFACITKNQLLVIDLLSEQNNLRTKTVDTASPIENVRGEEGFVQIGQQIISLKDLKVIHENRNQANLFMDQNLIQLVKDKNSVKITVDEQEIALLSDVPETLDNDLIILSTKCKQKKENNQIVCRFLLSTDDGALALAQQGKIKWIREEALTKIDAVEFLDLTLSDAQGAIEEELNSKDGKSNCFFINIFFFTQITSVFFLKHRTEEKNCMS